MFYHQTHAHPFTGIHETDIQDYYLPSPLVTHTGGTQVAQLRTSPIPLPSCRLMRRGRD